MDTQPQEEAYKLAELTKEEADALTADLQAVLLKHGCEMGVTSNINLLKRVKVEAPKAEEPTVSPIQLNDKEKGNEEETAV